jgi:transposase
MATIQSKRVRGHQYWYIVESRRVNGKPRPIVLAYLGKASNLLKRLQGLTDELQLKSYSHGAVAALLNLAQQLDVCSIINAHVKTTRVYQHPQPIRHHLTMGATLLLAAIGRVCAPTSKRTWWQWAKTTSLEYLLKTNFSKVDSQHFWDLMDALPITAIEKIEAQLLRNVSELYGLENDCLFYDTTNFFTYIHTTNERCHIAKRGRNKQKRSDLRQVGLALVVTARDKLPLFHLAYEGNLHDAPVFKQVIDKLKKRLRQLKLSQQSHTIVFDRGNNSKQNLQLIKEAGLHYVGALTPRHHRELIDDALSYFDSLKGSEKEMPIYRTQRAVWDDERTLVVYLSEDLKTGDLHHIHHALNQATEKLTALQTALASAHAKKYQLAELHVKIGKLLTAKYLNQLIDWFVDKIGPKRYQLHFNINQKNLADLKKRVGLRIIMTDHHNWDSEKIISTYQGQAHIENAFKHLKNPFHLAIKPQFHWTDQKIIVHYFICILGYLLTTLLYQQVKSSTSFQGSPHSLLDSLNNIRLGTFMEPSSSRGPLKAHYQLEKLSIQEQDLMTALQLLDFHQQRPKMNGVSVYN